jgi:LacI family transcriptional regulator
MASLKDVARLAEVSEGTASLVLNNRRGPKRTTRERVLAAAAELRYLPNAHARHLASRTTDTVGLVVTDIENPFFGSITRHIDEYLNKHNHTMVLMLSHDEINTETRALENLLKRGTRGMLVVPTQLSRQEFDIFRTIQEHGVPIVFVSSYYADLPGRRVLTDYEDGSFQLTKYLLDLGHRDISFLVSSDPRAPIYFERVRGYEKAYETYGLPLPHRSIIRCPKPDYASGYLMASKILSELRPDAIIAINDVMALGAKHAARAIGLHVPDNISIAGYDDVIFASLAEVPLTTVRQRIDEICRLAVEMLLENDSNLPEELRVKPELIVRKSTARVCNRSNAVVPEI